MPCLRRVDKRHGQARSARGFGILNLRFHGQEDFSFLSTGVRVNLAPFVTHVVENRHCSRHFCDGLHLYFLYMSGLQIRGSSDESTQEADDDTLQTYIYSTSFCCDQFSYVPHLSSGSVWWRFDTWGISHTNAREDGYATDQLPTDGNRPSSHHGPACAGQAGDLCLLGRRSASARTNLLHAQALYHLYSDDHRSPVRAI
jgi:hypothetical protein